MTIVFCCLWHKMTPELLEFASWMSLFVIWSDLLFLQNLNAHWPSQIVQKILWVLGLTTINVSWKPYVRHVLLYGFFDTRHKTIQKSKGDLKWRLLDHIVQQHVVIVIDLQKETIFSMVSWVQYPKPKTSTAQKTK